MTGAKLDDRYQSDVQGAALSRGGGEPAEKRKTSEQPNNIGLMRLIFASAVIFGHAPEMIDGNRSREPLTVIFGTLSLGELSVDGFFLLSGYLIVKSMLKTGAAFPFLERRVLRIYPAFIVAYILCVFVLGPLVNANVLRSLPRTLADMVLLREPPQFSGAFPGLKVNALNGSMWTIRIEFECYLAVLGLWLVGLLRRRWLILAVTISMIVATAWLRSPSGAQAQAALNRLHLVYVVLGHPFSLVRLFGVFLAGACFYLHRNWLVDRVPLPLVAVLGITAVAALYHDPVFAEAALVTCGGVFLFWIAFRARLGRLQTVNDKWDVSYGVYLYGWPVGIGLLYFLHLRSPLPLASSAFVGSLALGAASWWGLESRVKDRVRSRSRNSAPESASGALPA